MDPTDDFTKNEVFTEAYWKRPVSEKQGDANPHKIYEAVGFALTSWELAEEALADLYLNLVDASKASDDPVRRAFGSIESNSGRRNAINAAAEAFFGQDWEDKTIKRAFLLVTDAVGWAARRRDDTAHGIVLNQVLDGVSFGSFLFPPDYNTLRTHLYVDRENGDPLSHTMTKYRFTGAQVRAFGFKFKELQDAIRHHAGLIRLGAPTFIRFTRGVDIFGGKIRP